MTAILSAIRAKPDWETKIHNEKIVSKWLSELESQGVSRHLGQTAIDVLLYFLNKHEQSSGYSYYEYEYHWPVALKTNLNNLRVECRCHCRVCRNLAEDEASINSSESDSEII